MSIYAEYCLGLFLCTFYLNVQYTGSSQSAIAIELRIYIHDRLPPLVLNSDFVAYDIALFTSSDPAFSGEPTSKGVVGCTREKSMLAFDTELLIQKT